MSGQGGQVMVETEDTPRIKYAMRAGATAPMLRESVTGIWRDLVRDDSNVRSKLRLSKPDGTVPKGFLRPPYRLKIVPGADPSDNTIYGSSTFEMELAAG